ncbi:hypothetical protein [Mesocricetibacter intestinalis]|uniref:hypothetical protein n=1 Tax=Mesocricetibacter intestinalis TaxID=1521930 RepID=UPI00105BC584|nr:hypothetical protein [Mesocricetibacter intestinalis]
MSEFKILLIDDELEQEQQLKEAIDNFNKKDFINKAVTILGIIEENKIARLSMLDNKEEVYGKLKEDGNLNSEIDELFNSSVVYKAVKTPEEAMVLLYKENFHALIVDLKLESEDERKDDENYSGNILLQNIIHKEILPIIVRTGFPNKMTKKINKNIIKCYSKETPALEEIVKELIDYYKTSMFSIFGSRGKVDEYIKDFFWNILPACFIDKKEELNGLDKEIQEKVIIRYVSSWFNNKYMFDKKYIDAEPIEMYMFPNSIEQVCNCDIYERKYKESCDYYIVLTPSCDLANKKIDEVILCKIKKYNEVPQFIESLTKYNTEPSKTSKNAKKAKESLTRWFRNAHTGSIRYHFLPKFSKFSGGFIDFRSIISLKYDSKTGKIKNRYYKKIGVITESFKRDIVARFSSYYHRQGQPEFNSDSVLSNLK